MNTTKAVDWALRIVGLFAIPSLAWAWSLSLDVSELQNDLGDAEVQIQELKKNAEALHANNDDIIAMKKDIEYMKKTLDRIEIAVAN